jgi:hypothetical protein
VNRPVSMVNRQVGPQFSCPARFPIVFVIFRLCRCRCCFCSCSFFSPLAFLEAPVVVACWDPSVNIRWKFQRLFSEHTANIQRTNREQRLCYNADVGRPSFERRQFGEQRLRLSRHS